MGKVRSRASKVCVFCKNRKVKCDLGNPCSTCVKYKRSPCVYAADTADHEGGNGEWAKESAHSKGTSNGNGHPQSGLGNYSAHSSSSTVPTVHSSTFSTSSSLSSNASMPASSTSFNFNYNPEKSLFSPQTSSDSGSVGGVQDELSLLKQKLNSLEQQLTMKQQRSQNHLNLSPTNAQSTTMFQKQFGEQVSLNTSDHAAFAARMSTIPQSPVDSENRPIELKSLLGFNPIDSEEDSIDFHDNPTRDAQSFGRKNFGPLAWKSLLRVDNAMVPVWTHMDAIKNKYRGKGFLPHAEENAAQVEKEFTEKIYNDEADGEVRPYRDTAVKPLSQEKKLNITQEKLNEKAVCLGLAFYQGGLDAEMELVEKIRLVLPKQKVLWKLFKRFFAQLYVAMPFLDEMDLQDQIQKLIGAEDYQAVKVTVNVEKKLDFAYLGILLILLRFSYISLFSHDSSVNEINFQTDDPCPQAQSVKFLLNHPINIDVIDVAQLCLDQFNIARSASITLLQLALMMRIYHSLAPEDGDGIDGGDARVANAVLIQMAISIGLHRDPDYFHESYKDERRDNLGRKLWFFLLIQDLNYALASGSRMTLGPDDFDTKPPFYKPGNQNVRDVELEKIASSCFPDFDVVYGSMTKLFRLISKVRGTVKLKELTETLNPLEIHFKENYGSYAHDYALDQNPKHAMPNAIKLKIYFQASFFLVSIYLHLFNYYEKKNNLQLAFYYIKKMLVVVMDDVMHCFSRCVSHNQNMFKNSIDLIATPSFEMVAHKSMVVLCGVYLRLKYWTHSMQELYDHDTKMKSLDSMDIGYQTQYQKLVNFTDLLRKCWDTYRDGIAKLSHRYYYAWVVTKAQSFLKVMLTDEYFETYKPSIMCPPFTIEMLTELEHIAQNSLTRIQKMKKVSKAEKTRNLAKSCCSLEPNNNNNNNNNSTTEEHVLHHKNSVASTSSSEDYRPNDQVDTIWLQMMNMKNHDTSSRFIHDSGMNPVVAQTPSIFHSMDPNANATTSFSPAPAAMASASGSFGPGGFSGNLAYPSVFELNSGDMFENFPIDELFKDFS
ncbi:uncharacterized protein LODBEIA_P61220 [Lodderomyces beijingensis]|uniref:Zn(2)-C6 fungal-type domain-containing protein n=1 Tax=Lodderomyces beijingensis TaxID=1775926 RepID=A0ABP0ZVL0_9ASCO